MIVQMAAAGEPHFVITMDEHTALAGRFAEHFGNAQFEAVEPRAQMLHVIANHDAGWRELDRLALRDPATGLPYHLVQTPFEHIVATSKASPDCNGRKDAYCELISSMHSWGLYNGRYGMSDKVLLDGLAAGNRAVADRMLDAELERQAGLKARLAADPRTAAWVEPGHLFQNYKQLQFFDTLALYFNCTPAAQRTPTRFAHVPLSAARDTEVALWPAGDRRYALAPYPFDRDDIELSFAGRYLRPVEHGGSLSAALARCPRTTQAIRLVRG